MRLIDFVLNSLIYVRGFAYLSLLVARQGSSQDNVAFGRKAALLSMFGLSIVEQRQETDNGAKTGNAS